MNKHYKPEVVKILKDFDMPNYIDLLESLSDDQVKNLYILFQRIMVRSALTMLENR